MKALIQIFIMAGLLGISNLGFANDSISVVLSSEQNLRTLTKDGLDVFASSPYPPGTELSFPFESYIEPTKAYDYVTRNATGKIIAKNKSADGFIGGVVIKTVPGMTQTQVDRLNEKAKTSGGLYIGKKVVREQNPDLDSIVIDRAKKVLSDANPAARKAGNPETTGSCSKPKVDIEQVEGINPNSLSKATKHFAEAGSLPALQAALDFYRANREKCLESKDENGKKFNVKICEEIPFITVIDFTKNSGTQRMHVWNLNTGEVTTEFVAHGRNSGDRIPTAFSNQEGSKQSSPGAYVTGKPKAWGKFDNLGAMYIYGVEIGCNDNAACRDVIFHGSKHFTFDRDYIEKRGRMGRSWGCPACPADAATAIRRKICGRDCDDKGVRIEGSLFYIYVDPKNRSGS